MLPSSKELIRQGLQQWLDSYEEGSKLAQTKSLCGVVDLMQQTHVAYEDLTRVFTRLARDWPKHSGDPHYPIFDKEQWHLTPDIQWNECAMHYKYARGNQGLLRKELALFVIGKLS